MKETYVKSWLKDALGIFNLELGRLLRDGGVMIIFIVLCKMFVNFVTKRPQDVFVDLRRDVERAAIRVHQNCVRHFVDLLLVDLALLLRHLFRCHTHSSDSITALRQSSR